MLSRRIIIDLPDVPAWFVHSVADICNVLIHQALANHGSPAVCVVIPLEDSEKQEKEDGAEN